MEPPEKGRVTECQLLSIPHLRNELRDAVKRVRRKPRIIQGFFRGAKLLIFMTGSVVYLALLLVAMGGHGLAQEILTPPKPVPPALGPPPPREETILSPIPRQFDWMRSEVGPNPPLESLLSLREVQQGLFMAVSLAEEYSDNFFLTQSGRESAYLTSLGIGTAYRLERERSFVSLASTINGRYDTRSEQSTFAFANLSLNAGHELPRLSLALNESFIRSDDVAEASPIGVRRERRPFLRNSVSPQVRYDLTRNSSVNLAYTNTLVRDQGVEGTDNVPLVQDGGPDRGNSTTNAFTTGLQHAFTRNLSSRASYTFTTSNNTTTADTRAHVPSVDLDYIYTPGTSASFRAFGTITHQSNGGTDSDFYGVSVGVRRQLTPSLTAFFAIGPTVFDREDRGPRIFANWQANLDGALPLTRQTNLTFSSQQSINNTAGDVEDVGVVLTQSATLTLTHSVYRDLFALLFINYARTEFLQNGGTSETTRGRKDNYWTGGATISYALTRIFSLSGSYRYQRRDSDLATGDFDENRFTIALSAAFQIF